jgi:hypothetical protein
LTPASPVALQEIDFSRFGLCCNRAAGKLTPHNEKHLSKPTLEMRVLRRAADLLGGERALARELRVPSVDVLIWLEGTERPTRPVFIAAVDLLIEHGDVYALGAEAFAAPAPNEQRADNFFRAEEEKKS